MTILSYYTSRANISVVIKGEPGINIDPNDFERWLKESGRWSDDYWEGDATADLYDYIILNIDQDFDILPALKRITDEYENR